jgi:protein-tyrosine phosphatase
VLPEHGHTAAHIAGPVRELNHASQCSATARRANIAYARAVRICFVCLGNICRSPTAEAVMQRLIVEAGLGARVTLDSAGTGRWHAGERADPRSRAAAAARGIEITHRARQLVAGDLDRFDLLVVMDTDNLAAVRALVGARDRPEVRLLRSYDPAAPAGAEVPDPYAGGADGFDHVLDLCEAACRPLVAHVRHTLEAR